MVLRVKEAWRGGDAEERPGWYVTVHLDDDWKLDMLALKRTVPPEERHYDEVERRWWVSDSYALRLADVVHGLAVFLNQPQFPGM